MKILHVVGARPNFIKAAPVVDALRRHGVQNVVVHTGQHRDESMSRVFFEQLSLSVDHSLNAMPQLTAIMDALVPVMEIERPDWVFVYGDVTSTLAAALCANTLKLKVAHVEAGLRSFDKTMPEEINRILVDHVAQLLFVSCREGIENLQKENATGSVYFVGNVMIDTLIQHRRLAEDRAPTLLREQGLDRENFILLTLHRPGNVDNSVRWQRLWRDIDKAAEYIPILYPVHPRASFRVAHINGRVKTINPLGYIDFLAMLGACRLVVTDSGGVQEEASYLGIPCITVRDSTERQVTVKFGTNTLVRDCSRLSEMFESAERRDVRIELWDGQSAERIALYTPKS